MQLSGSPGETSAHRESLKLASTNMLLANRLSGQA